MRKNRDSRSGAFIRSKPNGLEPSPWWFWITLGWSHGRVPATYPSKVCPINCRLWHRRPQWFWRVTGNYGSIPEREPEKRLPHLRKAAGAQITQSWHREVVTRNNTTGYPCLVGNSLFVDQHNWVEKEVTNLFESDSDLVFPTYEEFWI